MDGTDHEIRSGAAEAHGLHPILRLRPRIEALTRVIAGPVNARTLASYGADVLHVASRHLPNVDRLVIDTGMGRLATMLDLRTRPMPPCTAASDW